MFKWIKALFSEENDPCPSGGNHDWDMIYMDWESLPVYYCNKCKEMEWA